MIKIKKKIKSETVTIYRCYTFLYSHERRRQKTFSSLEEVVAWIREIPEKKTKPLDEVSLRSSLESTPLNYAEYVDGNIRIWQTKKRKRTRPKNPYIKKGRKQKKEEKKETQIPPVILGWWCK